MSFGPRRGGFGATLDPFGSGRGGLGRYNVTGDTIQSLAEYEAYAVAVAWANGTATDDEYLASLAKLLSLTTPGTKENVTAQNRLDDAKYTIGRNEIVREVNNATSGPARISALTRLQQYDRQRLNAMTATDSEAYREQQDRVAGAGVDIRQAKYAELVEKVNRGKATVQQLLDMATALRQQAAGAPDADDWGETVAGLRERVADDKLADGFQAYQHNRKSGASLLREIDARLSQMTPGSPAYKELQRQREDLAERVTDQRRAVTEAEVQGKRAGGQITDAAYLAYLKKSYEEETPGTSESINAGNRLRDFTFSLAEDKLRFDVGKGKRSVGDLIRFYKTYQRSMNPGSERWRQLQSAIDSLSRRGGVGGGGGGRGGGGGGGGGGSGVALGPKIISGDSLMTDLLGGKGKPAPPGFADLFKIDVTNSTSRKWFDNNLRSMTEAFQDGRGTWLYYDKRGNSYELPFVPSFMADMDSLNIAYMHRGLALAGDSKEAQTWVGRIITATKAGQSRNATYTMDVYTKTYAAIERAKQQAMAGGRYGEYSNLVREQLQLARFILGTPEGQPPDSGNATNPYLTADQKARIMADLGQLAPRNNDEQSPFYNPEGDPVLGMIQSGAITTMADPVTGDILSAQLDPNRGYVSQAPDGSIVMVEINSATNPEAFRPDEVTGDLVPRYRDDNINVTIRLNGEDVSVWQPVTVPTEDQLVKSGGLLYQITPGVGGKDSGLQGMTSQSWYAAAGVGPASGKPGSAQPVIDPTGRTASMGLFTTYTVERGKTVKWISTDGTTWIRYGDATSVAPRIVVDSSFKLGADGKWTRDGKEVSTAEVLQASHIWGADDAVAAGATNNPDFGVGAPGASFQVRKPRWENGMQTNTFDFRSDYIIDSEERAALYLSEKRRGQRPQDAEFEVRGRGYGVADPGLQRDQTSRNANAPQNLASDFIFKTGALLDKVARMNGSLPARPKTPGQLEAGLRDWGVKPTPSPTLKPPPVAGLGPTKMHVAPGSTASLKPSTSKLTLPPIRKPPPPPKKKAPPPPKPPYGAPGAYRPPAPKPTSSSGGSKTKRIEL